MIQVLHEAISEPQTKATHRMLVTSAIPASAAALYAFHEAEDSFPKLIPPWQKMRLISFERKGGGLDVGTRAVVEMAIGPFWKRWIAEHTACIPGAMFADEQREGPFAYFRHEHRMVALGPNESRLEDEVRYRLPLDPVGRIALRLIQKDMERGFRYRHKVTLEALSSSQVS
jgi:uncharacterized protein